MGSVGDCFDNAMCESFFATLECELLDRRRFKTQTEARMAVFDFIEDWYNPHRRHSALDYLSPINYESDRIGFQERRVAHKVHRLWDRRSNPACGLLDNAAPGQQFAVGHG
jgi:hypothetical protein